MIKINVFIKNNSWKKYIKNPESYLKKKINKLNKNIFFRKKKLEFTLLLTEDKFLKKLNHKFRNKNKTTDILSFPSEKRVNFKKRENNYIGDIAINLSKIIKNSDEKDFKLKFNKVWIHGFAHLLGHKHKKNSDYLKMKKVEKVFLKIVN